MTDWATISSLATAAGTLVLAIATFASVRSANAAARNAERALLQGLRPLLFPSRLSDEPIKVSFADQHWLRVAGGHGVIEHTGEVIYLAMSLRNVGSGTAVLDGWVATPGGPGGATPPGPPDLGQFRRLTRDLYVPSGDVFFWQGALRDRSDPAFTAVTEVLHGEQPLTVDLLYGDEEGGQRTVTRFALLPQRDQEGAVTWVAVVARHWNIDRPAPR